MTIVLGKNSFLRCECAHHSGARCTAEGVNYYGFLKFWLCADCAFKCHGEPPWRRRIENPPAQFVSVRTAVMQGSRCVGRMVSKTMAKRTANALNRHKPNREGV